MEQLKKRIRELAKEKGATILAHNYQRPEVQDVADYTGDSLELARRATQVDADVIVFCGVYFMAETAAILNPEKKVLIPDPDAGCPMADMVTAEELREFKKLNPGAKTVCYVNSTAEVKAECDICVTSGNAEKVMAAFSPDEKIIFVPDKHLGSHIASKLGREYILWNGFCPIHAKLDAEMIAKVKSMHPGVKVLVHPESAEDVRDAADECLSTGGMCARAKNGAEKEFIVGTEIGILHRLQTENPDKKFYPVCDCLICEDMKKTTLESLLAALEGMKTEVKVPVEIALPAKRAIDAMLALS
jgi:quinolinate synthase